LTRSLLQEEKNMTRKIIAFGLIIVVVLVLGLQFFLAYGLTDSLRKWVLPVIKERYDADISVGSISVNLFAGSLSVNSIKLNSAPGFDEPTILGIDRCGLKVGLPALFRGGSAEIQKAIVKDMTLNIIRNKNGALNIQPLLASMYESQKGVTSSAGSAGGQPEAQAGKQHQLPNITIRKMESFTKFDYTDWQIGEPFKLGLELDLRLNNIANYGPEDSLSGVINLNGNLLQAKKKCAFDLNGRISPVTNPLLVSFDLSGSMQTADLKTFKGLIESIGLQDGKISATIKLVCRHGQFDEEKSVINLKFSDVVLTPEKAEKMKGIPLPSSFNVPVPVKGLLANPQVYVAAAFVKVITSDAMVDSIVRGIIESKKSSAGQTTGTKGTKNGKSGDLQGALGDFFGGK
jgi:hypothetical protein